LATERLEGFEARLHAHDHGDQAVVIGPFLERADPGVVRRV